MGFNKIKILAGISIITNQILIPMMLVNFMCNISVAFAKVIALLLLFLLIPNLKYLISIIKLEYKRNKISYKLVLLVLFPYIFLFNYSIAILRS